MWVKKQQVIVNYKEPLKPRETIKITFLKEMQFDLGEKIKKEKSSIIPQFPAVEFIFVPFIELQDFRRKNK